MRLQSSLMPLSSFQLISSPHMPYYASGGGCSRVAIRAQQLLEQSILDELRDVVAKSLSSCDSYNSSHSDLHEVSHTYAVATDVKILTCSGTAEVLPRVSSCMKHASTNLQLGKNYIKALVCR